MSKRKASLTSPGRQVTFVSDQDKPGPAKRTQDYWHMIKQMKWTKCFICEKENSNEKPQCSMDAITANAEQ